MMEQYKFWPFHEAEKILKRFGENQDIIFETGYGPSGLPHIGTFGEVLRTTAIMNALKKICPNITTKIIVISDDMDGLRKIPDNIPNQDMLSHHLDKPLTMIPDPFSTHNSYGEHMNMLLCKFLDLFGFQYEFKSATQCYNSGIYDDKLLLLLKNYDKVMNVMLPTLGSERQKTYSPFLPICPKTSRVLQVPIINVDTNAGTISYRDNDGKTIEIPVTGGKCKLQWKPDWGMRWSALNIKYEAYGKDLQPSAELSSKICEILGSEPPVLFCYELFLDKDGKKISKSKGNGISIEDWLSYAPSESLALYILQNPRKAKKLYFDVIPRSMDDYLDLVDDYHNNPNCDNPVWHIHNGNVPVINIAGLSFSLLLNLASVCNAEKSEVLWGFIKKYKPDDSVLNNRILSQLVDFSVKYYHDFVKPHKIYKIPDDDEKIILDDLKSILSEFPDNTTAEEIQNSIFSLGKKYYFNDLRSWFQRLYEILLGQSHGPRLGSFIKLYGIDNTVELINQSLGRQ
ncbi:lysine--tRNA ligase [Ehrlichia ruminantium]|uniref:Lysine--tRNA ligase n=1 Tax=Ehrlichia ruminantium TaxID=779 RepID=A0AAE6QB98_EHRRU|nr:lysine--tRNA ligase [Ehrlichia ruminantium]QGR02981.1 lysine--tRNA ligase [Ehrlichia ruminantium]QGR03907.1 lysine--tRNA ligase [Ehrlichia ruminantium]QGR04830.1 lysine--tRNA ligase [Ehrlichia ruminantium]